MVFGRQLDSQMVGKPVVGLSAGISGSGEPCRKRAFPKGPDVERLGAARVYLLYPIRNRISASAPNASRTYCRSGPSPRQQSAQQLVRFSAGAKDAGTLVDG